MKPILIDDRLDPGQFGDLVDQRLGVVAGEFMTTTATRVGLAVERLADLLRRHQGTARLTMSALPAAFLLAGRSRRFPFHPNRIGRGRLGRVGGIELEPVLEIDEAVLKEGNALLINLYDGEECRL